MESKKNFESKLGRLEEIVNLIESGDTELEKSIKLFEEGMKLSKECQKELDEAEQKVKILTGDGEEKDFDGFE